MAKLTAEELLAKYTAKIAHAIEVRRLAMIIFDETCEKIHDLSNKERRYLEAGALLHDIGYHIGSKGHNKHSMKIVMEEGIEGFGFHELMIIACICRYHRGGLPDKNEHEIYCELDKKDRKTVKRLGGILRLADGLDRGHLNLIKKIRLDYDEENNIAKFILTPNTPEFLPDISFAVRKRDLYEIGFKCQSVLVFERD